jgi:hypothetical protein
MLRDERKDVFSDSDPLHKKGDTDAAFFVFNGHSIYLPANFLSL